MKFPARNKYGVSPREERAVDGIVFDSKKELNRYAELKLLERAGVIQNLEIQPQFDLVVSPVDDPTTKITCGYYKADFRYEESGQTKVEDVKGVKTKTYRLKKKLVEAIHGITIIEL